MTERVTKEAEIVLRGGRRKAVRDTEAFLSPGDLSEICRGSCGDCEDEDRRAIVRWWSVQPCADLELGNGSGQPQGLTLLLRVIFHARQ